MDMSVDPCDDFYQFACGNYIKTHNIPDDKTSVKVFSEIRDQLTEKLRTTVEEPLMPNEPKPFKLVKHLYQACMNKTLIESRGLEPMKHILSALGGWPVVEGYSWNVKFNWLDSVYTLQRLGYNVDYFMDCSVSVNTKNSSYRIIGIDEALLGLSREYLVNGFKDKIVNAYYNYQVDIAVLFGADRSRAEQEFRESLDFEIKLANISLPSEELRNFSKFYNIMTIGEMQSKYPSIPWLEYIRNFLPSGIEVTNSEPVVVPVPQYVKDMEILINQTQKRVLANYMMWRVVASSIFFLTEELRNRQLKYYTVVFGTTDHKPRWKECINVVADGLPLSIGSLYVRKYFKEDAKKDAVEIVENIHSEFLKILDNVDWMDDDTRTRALEKAKAIDVHIAYPDELLDISKLDGFYKKLEISQNDYLEDFLNLSKFITNYKFGNLRKKVNKGEWIAHGTASVVNAFYSFFENSIEFPAGILQGIFFNNERPRYMNYGAIGFIIGHEITHGFDDRGQQFDKDGNLADWWAPDTKQKYLEKASCIISQYGNYTDEETGLKLNGINTQGENIADNGGIKEAYGAYVEWSKKNGPEPALPGLPYSPRQLFWISAAQTWCSKHRPEAMRLQITTGCSTTKQDTSKYFASPTRIWVWKHMV